MEESHCSRLGKHAPQADVDSQSSYLDYEWLLKDVAPDIPVITHCHATGLRQMELCPHLAEEVARGVSRNDHFVVLHKGQEQELQEKLHLPLHHNNNKNYRSGSGV